MVFSGTVIAAGRGEAVVVDTGMRSEFGKIATMVQQAGVMLTPLQIRLKGFSKLIIVVVLVVMALVFLLGWLRGLPLREIFMVALSQAVSAIPEGLPVAVTVALAVGMQRMARRRSVIRKLAAVETLGSATVICTDKTGTLTKNEMSVTRVVLPDADRRQRHRLRSEGRFPPHGGGVRFHRSGGSARRVVGNRRAVQRLLAHRAGWRQKLGSPGRSHRGRAGGGGRQGRHRSSMPSKSAASGVGKSRSPRKSA
jgi:magnesium-transporting ATPase (P-type)